MWFVKALHKVQCKTATQRQKLNKEVISVCNNAVTVAYVIGVNVDPETTWLLFFTC